MRLAHATSSPQLGIDYATAALNSRTVPAPASISTGRPIGNVHFERQRAVAVARLAVRERAQHHAVPRPRLHLIGFGVRITSLREVSGPPLREHGVLAPNAKLRALVVPQEVPQEPEPAAQESKPAECEANCAHRRPVRLSWAKLLKRVLATT